MNADRKVMEEGLYKNGTRDGISRRYVQEGKMTINTSMKMVNWSRNNVLSHFRGCWTRTSEPKTLLFRIKNYPN
jgi:hypothetical protein